MSVNECFFCVGDQWNIVHLPRKPNGFAVLILGDVNHYVSKSNSFWLQHPERTRFVEILVQNGYTVFSSNLYGRNWGSWKASDLAEKVYHSVLRREILNKKIHIIAEGR